MACHFLQNKLHDRISFTIPDGGMSIWVQFKDVDVKDVSKAAAQLGLAMCDGTKHNTVKKNFNSICLGFASLNDDELHQALTLLNRSVNKVYHGVAR